MGRAFDGIRSKETTGTWWDELTEEALQERPSPNAPIEERNAWVAEISGAGGADARGVGRIAGADVRDAGMHQSGGEPEFVLRAPS